MYLGKEEEQVFATLVVPITQEVTFTQGFVVETISAQDIDSTAELAPEDAEIAIDVEGYLCTDKGEKEAADKVFDAGELFNICVVSNDNDYEVQTVDWVKCVGGSENKMSLENDVGQFLILERQDVLFDTEQNIVQSNDGKQVAVVTSRVLAKYAKDETSGTPYKEFYCAGKVSLFDGNEEGEPTGYPTMFQNFDDFDNFGGSRRLVQRMMQAPAAPDAAGGEFDLAVQIGGVPPGDGSSFDSGALVSGSSVQSAAVHGGNSDGGNFALMLAVGVAIIAVAVGGGGPLFY